ncbi:meiosis regulator and mRNA stability factor 1 isoform X2 [Drosophila ananassae]|uniref:meiosis regulator and mRNA stability factor 1 isoform X2 n=1 Tax=Drosophila ananassae TaxID=7217 RepID=UPI001CFFFDE8|nr:meiosis regulator and mRNA stability factor 1 isoform X2 [Drosophila ananassae]
MLPGIFPTYGVKTATSSISTQLCQYAHSQGIGISYYNSLYMPYNQNPTCETSATAGALLHRPMVNEYQQPLQQQVYHQPSTMHKQASNMCSLLQPLNPLSLPSSSRGLLKSLPTSEVTTNSFLMQDFTKSNIPQSCAEKNCLKKFDSLVDFDEGPLVNEMHCLASIKDVRDTVTLQITNLDYSLDESSLRSFLLNQLKPITPVLSLVFEGSAYAKVTVPDLYFAKQVVSNMHRKKIGHKRMLVSYTRDSSLTEVNTLRCQVAGLLKDVPYYTLPMYKFRELFQSRFKTSISVLDLYKMSDVCTITSDNNEDKFISLQPDLLNTLENSPLMEELQHSVPYCTMHFRREQHKGWAEQEIEPLPNVFMSISEIQNLIYPLLKLHTGDVPVATLLYCIEEQLQVKILANESGVNLEHLVCCVQGIQIHCNNFGIKILGWLEINKDRAFHLSSNISSLSSGDRSIGSAASGLKHSLSDPLYQISREVIELVKMSPKSTMKFNRFIPAYHNHFGKQCRVADYGYTKLIELFEALSSVVQIMGDGENRQITLTHRTQTRRFTSDLLRVLRAHGNNSVLLSQLPGILSQSQNKNFDISDYGVCSIVDILDGLVNSNIVVVNTVQNGKDILISMPKRKQTSNELEKTSVFAGEIVELLQNSLQYSILFQKFVRSYHYHFSYQCRLSDYGFLKLTDLMDAIQGLVEMEIASDEDKKICLSPYVARRVFAEQCGDLINNAKNIRNAVKLDHVLKLHKKKFGYQMQAQTLGASDMMAAVKMLPYIEVKNIDQAIWLICRKDDLSFRNFCYRACTHLIRSELLDQGPYAGTEGNTHFDQSNKNSKHISKDQFINEFNSQNKYHLNDSILSSMSHAIEIYKYADKECVRLTGLLRFLVSIVRILEHRRSMHLHEIKKSLKCGLGATFEFGFPNLYELLSAYEDLFTLDYGASHERCNVSLNANCELRLCTQLRYLDMFGSIKFTNAKKIDEFESNKNNFANSVIAFPTSENTSLSITNSSLISSFGSGQGNSSFTDSMDMNDNFLNSSLKLFNSSFNTSGDLDASLGAGDLTKIVPNVPMTENYYEHSLPKLWRRRKVSSYPQPLQHMNTNISQQKRKASNGLYDLMSSSKQLKGSFYGPPKPDIPSDDQRLPFWIDPIWSNKAEEPNPMNIVNVRPEFNSKNTFPLLLSPYTISKNENIKRKLLGMDNHDRKIA